MTSSSILALSFYCTYRKIDIIRTLFIYNTFMRAFYIIFLLVFLASCRGDAEIIATPQQTEQQEEAISTDDSDAEEETL